MIVPEMVKPRPVVVIAPKLKHRSGLVTVVPLSTTQPQHLMPYHHEITLERPLPYPWNDNPCWAICDHPMTVCFERLSLPKLGKDQTGKRKYLKMRLKKVDVDGVRRGVLEALSLGHLWT